MAQLNNFVIIFQGSEVKAIMTKALCFLMQHHLAANNESSFLFSPFLSIPSSSWQAQAAGM